MKHCKKCDQDKPLSEFHNDKNRKDGKYPYCKPCACKSAAHHKSKVPEQRLAYNRFHKYGVTPEVMSGLTILQDNKCAGCKKPFTKTPHLDHCHETGAVRGLLCTRCNTALGLLEDDIQTLLNLSEYLRVSHVQPGSSDRAGSCERDADEHRQSSS